jgi:glucose-1-phosphate thymidylyltransferase
MKGIVLAGGVGTRLYPLTKGVSKQLLPIYDKPMIYYPISTLMLGGIREILIISTAKDINNYKALLGDGSDYGCEFSYLIQEKPRGLAEAFIIGEDFIGKDDVCLILGDNFFYVAGFTALLETCMQPKDGIIFAIKVQNPSEYGVVKFDKNMKAEKIVEKPKDFLSPYAVPGLYFYSNKVINVAKNIEPSPRGELEISSVNQHFIEQSSLEVKFFGRGATWLDTGSAGNLLRASHFVEIIQNRQNISIGSIEEIAFIKNFITKEKLLDISKCFNNEYGAYLQSVANI